MIIISILCILFVIGIDQLTKVLLLNTSFTYIPKLLYNMPTLNDGAAFSMMSGGRIYFIIFTAIILLVAMFFLFTNKFSDSKLFKASLAVTVGGIIGNFIDRILFGSVRDFLLVEPMGFICNIADIAICVGTALVCIYIVFLHSSYKKKKGA